MTDVMVLSGVVADENHRLVVWGFGQIEIMQLEKLMVQHPLDVDRVFGCAPAAKSSDDVPIAKQMIQQRIRKLPATTIRFVLAPQQTDTSESNTAETGQSSFHSRNLSEFHLSRDAGNAKVFQ